MEIDELKKLVQSIRINIIEMLAAAGSGHPGGSLSMVDILTVLYFEKMNVRPDMPKWKDRDRFVLSKGHAAPGLYSVLAERGYFPKEELVNLRKIDAMLQGHPDMKRISGIDMSTGSLGQGLSVANGMALAAKLDKKSYRVYAIVGDGELQEGQIWEAAMSSAQYHLDNLTLIVDNNGLQIDGTNAEVMNVDPIGDKFKAFGWHVLEIDGHDFLQIRAAIDLAQNLTCKPTVIIAKTVKGKGVSFMENQVGWHGSAPNQKQKEEAIAELEGSVTQ